MLTDRLKRPLRDVRISVIDRCNFRCPYCMPESTFDHSYRFLDKSQWLSFDEITRLSRLCVSLGAVKLRITGGEPLLRPNIDDLIRQLGAIKGVRDLALTTNGVLLPQWAGRLKEAGLKRLTVSLDTLDESVFARLSGNKGKLRDVLNGIQAAEQAGFTLLKINTVVQRGVNEAGVLDLVRHFRGTGHTLRFIEYMDVGNHNHWSLTHVVPTKDIVQRIDAVFPLERVGGTDGGETSERFRFKDGKGEIGFISSVSRSFCGTCSRMRISADGKIYTCLFAAQGTDVRRLLQSGADDAAVTELIRSVWEHREDRYSELRSTSPQKNQSPKVEMFHIGG